MSDDTLTDRRGGWRDVATQFALVFGAAIFYFLVRGVTQGSVERAERNGESVLRVERVLGLDVETEAQDLILDHDVLVTLANWVYIWGHWPVIIVTLFALHRWRPVDYLRLRDALFVSGAIGVVIYMTFPVSPPRLLDPLYRDTVTDLSSSYRVFQPPALVNKYAAMPSLHAGWNLLAGMALYGATRNRALRSVAVAGPIAMAFAVVLTANHYVLDVVAGEAVALAGLALSLRWWPRPTWTSATGSRSVVHRRRVGDGVPARAGSDRELDPVDRACRGERMRPSPSRPVRPSAGRRRTAGRPASRHRLPR
ncbi:phosphatase PAP2 family protein [Ilumatobacter sp.]|uniref:phosphatase PAP2 family protein n=1 Tax=Ilumatobacter sp. TaxID=1967498 RepID=UPI003AF4CB18